MVMLFERLMLVGVGLIVGLGLSRTPFEAAAIPGYVVAVTLILAARWAVDRWRDGRPRRA